ncbi:MAG: D-glycerate dehydrogenase [Phycisphaerales bacterium]|nr:D-glycerate dehydrogenase [Phycisphaerales bacterium]
MPTDRPLVRVSRPLPGDFDVGPADVAFGPARGFASPDELRAFVRGASALVTWVSERVDAALLDAAGPGLKLVANFAVGFDNIDLAACRARGVRVSNTPDAVTEGTADCAWALLLAAARRLSHADRFARSGAWAAHGVLGPAELIGRPVAGQTLLIVGAGRIGYATALRSIGWGMKVLYTDRSPVPAFEHAPLNAERTDLDDGLRRADFVSLHVPLTPDTRHLIDARRLALMKPTAVLVNTARGPVVDEAALAEALSAGRIFAAGLDVFEKEPAVHPGLAGLDNVVMTPHFGSASATSRAAMARLCAANVRAVLAGGEPVTPVV